MSCILIWPFTCHSQALEWFCKITWSALWTTFNSVCHTCVKECYKKQIAAILQTSYLNGFWFHRQRQWVKSCCIRRFGITYISCNVRFLLHNPCGLRSIIYWGFNSPRLGDIFIHHWTGLSLLPVWHQAIILTNAGLIIRLSGTNIPGNWIKIPNFSHKIKYLNMSTKYWAILFENMNKCLWFLTLVWRLPVVPWFKPLSGGILKKI